MARAIACTEPRIHAWFAMFRQMLREEGIPIDPSLIFNSDETGFPFQTLMGWILTGACDRNVYSIVASTKTIITSLIAINANGSTFIPPSILFPVKTAPHPGVVVEIKEMGGDAMCTDSGWMTRDAFHHWIQKVFYPNLPKHASKVVLLVDGHSSHTD